MLTSNQGAMGIHVKQFDFVNTKYIDFFLFGPRESKKQTNKQKKKQKLNESKQTNKTKQLTPMLSPKDCVSCQKLERRYDVFTLTVILHQDVQLLLKIL